MTLATGARLGPYEILAPIAAGGMGEVYRARDGRLERDVAVKVLPERLATDEEARARFENEARAVAALSHPNILSIHDFGVEGGVAYSVTELLEGETLRRRLDRARLSIATAVELALPIAAALGAAHEKGIVHRDVKPENVFVTRDGRVKVLDFGVAKREAEAAGAPASTTADTASGYLVGTVGYMSPEQIRGEPVDPRSDLFSFGCVLYEMVTGSRAFRKATPADTLAAVLNEDPPAIDLRESGCPPDLARLIDRCLRKERDSRFQSARDLAYALENAGRSPRGAARRGRRRAIVSLAVLPFENGSAVPENDYLAEGITEDLINGLARDTKIRVIARSSIARFRSAESDPRAVGRDLDVAAVVTGRVTLRGTDLDVRVELVDAEDGSQLWGQRYRREVGALLLLEEEITAAVASRLRPRRKEPPVRASPRASSEAYDLYLRGRFQWNKRTEEGFEKALSFFEQAIALDPEFALAYAGTADAYVFLGGYGHLAPEIALPRAKEAAERALALADIADAHNSLASVLHRFAWDFPGAEAEFRRALQENPAHATAHHWYSLFLLTMGRFEESREEIERARALDPLSLVVWEDAGYWHYCRREYARAESEFRKVLEMDAGFLPARFDLAIVLSQRGAHAESVAEARQAAEAAARRPRPLATLAWALAAAGESAEARALLQRLETAPVSSRAPHFSLALVKTALGEKDAAFESLFRALERREDSLVSLRSNPRLDTLRGDARFEELLRRVGFPPVPVE